MPVIIINLFVFLTNKTKKSEISKANYVTNWSYCYNYIHSNNSVSLYNIRLLWKLIIINLFVFLTNKAKKLEISKVNYVTNWSYCYNYIHSNSSVSLYNIRLLWKAVRAFITFFSFLRLCMKFNSFFAFIKLSFSKNNTYFA